ncbi:Amidophosphoribosyltransferase [hydrothermal vent metagenome]|uniref:amidophosphoribosyltransferase n=1 Tax=hydrothermal vent metagenome TaxID=652676 RepID=A0A3B0R0P0_9ZZZZ
MLGESEDKYKDECGVVGIYNHPEASKIAYLALYALQHRGQESAGIATTDGRQIFSHKSMGLVADIFRPAVLEKLPGNSAVGHVRYATAGESHVKNAQPFVVDYARGSIAIAHNGNLVNAGHLKDELEAYGSIFQSTMDTEVIVHLLASSKENSIVDRLCYALGRVQGAYSIVLQTETRLIAARDPNGFRPLVLGRAKEGWVIASETCAFDLIEAEYIREIAPGEILVIDKKGLTSHKPFEPAPYTPCVFELIYFARPDSDIFGTNVYEVRKNLGRVLAEEHPVEADIVIPVPDSGVGAAVGYAEASGIPFDMGLVRNHYIGRTFIEPQDSIRHFGVKIKLNPVKGILAGKRVVVVDDSIVRGTTSRKIIKMLKDAGVKEVHLRISSPPTIAPCFYGIDTPTKDELIASSHTVEEINRYVTSDSLGYMSIEGVHRAAKMAGSSFCDACFTKNYPVEVTSTLKVRQMALFK